MTGTTRLRVARISRTFYYVPLWLGLDQGMFGGKGLDIEVEQVGDGALATSRLRDGDLDITIAPPDGVIADSAAGGPLRVIAGNTSGLSHDLIALPRFHDIASLRGARIGVISLTEGSTMHFQEIARRHGLGPDDYVLDPVGGVPTRHRLLLEGRIDAALQSIPFTYLAEEAGLRRLASARDYVPDYQFNTINAHGQWARQNRDTVVRFLEVMLAATARMYAEPELAVETAVRHIEVSPVHARRGFEEFVELGVMPADLSVSEPGLDAVADLMAKAGVIANTPATADYLDLGYLQAAKQKS